MKIALPTTLGCGIISTAVIKSLQEIGPVDVYTNHDFIPGKPLHEYDGCGIDLRAFPWRMNIHAEKKHLLEIMYCFVERISGPLIRHRPHLTLSEDVMLWAQKQIKEKPVVWMQTKSSIYTKDWVYWYELKSLLQEYDVKILNEENYTPLQSIAMTKVAAGGICLDSFLLHGSYAVDADNVLTILGSSRKEVVVYPSTDFIYSTACPIQPCGLHTHMKQDPPDFCKMQCMKKIPAEAVHKKFMRMVQKKDMRL